MSRLLPLLLLLPLACAPVRGDDDDDATANPCPDGECGLVVANDSIDCGTQPDPLPPDGVEVTVGEGWVDVAHYAFASGCCPEYDITATVVPEDGAIVVQYNVANDFCDCICELSAALRILDPPPGSWDLVLPGVTVPVEI